MDRRLSSVLVMALCFLAAPRISPGQDVTVSTTGLVTDTAARLVPGAKAIARNVGTNATFQVTSDREGVYRLRQLPIGEYTPTVTAAGFQTFEAKPFRLQVNEVARLDVPLAVGSTNTVITVEAAPLKEYLVATLRLEAFNATNAVNLGQPSTTVTSSMFMRITSAGRPRILQLALRFKW